MKLDFERPNNLSEKERTHKIRKQLEYAIAHPILAKDVKVLIEKTKGLSLKEMKKVYLDTLNFKDATAEFKTIGDFREAGQLLGWDKKELEGYSSYLDYLIEHENAHINVADQEGAIVHGYNIIMMKEEDGKIYPQPGARYDVPEGLSDDDNYRIEMLAVIAPETYGNFLSPGDKLKVEMLNEERNKDLK